MNRSTVGAVLNRELPAGVTAGDEMPPGGMNPYGHFCGHISDSRTRCCCGLVLYLPLISRLPFFISSFEHVVCAGRSTDAKKEDTTK